MITKFPAAALSWWLESQNKLNGAKVGTKEVSENVWEISEWEVSELAKPTDAEVDTIITDYQTHLTNEKDARKTRKQAVRTKLGLTKSELKALLEIVLDGHDD